MLQQTSLTWWRPGVRASAGAIALGLIVPLALPLAAKASDAPLLDAMATHSGYLYGIAVLMGIVGWVDSALLYRRLRLERQKPRAARGAAD